MTDGFDWHDDADILLKRQDAIALYTNNDNDIVIRRERQWDEEDDVHIVIPRSAVRRMIERLERLLRPVEVGNGSDS
jgi:hypothetical protein